MKHIINALPKEAKDKHIENKKYFDKLKKKTPKNLDYIMQDLHNAEFKKTDCLKCANCCKTTSPVFKQKDIEAISKRLKMKPSAFIDKYLHIDSDSDYVLNTAPCSFLDHENYCMIYEDRPTACREYPHTDRKKMFQLLDLTQKNTLVCPAVLEIVERLKKIEIK